MLWLGRWREEETQNDNPDPNITSSVTWAGVGTQSIDIAYLLILVAEERSQCACLYTPYICSIRV
jgi:hypothetical protein